MILIKRIFRSKPLSIYYRRVSPLFREDIKDVVITSSSSQTTFHYIIEKYMYIICERSTRSTNIQRKKKRFPVLIDIQCLCIWMEHSLTLSVCQIGSFIMLALFHLALHLCPAELKLNMCGTNVQR